MFSPTLFSASLPSGVVGVGAQQPPDDGKVWTWTLSLTCRLQLQKFLEAEPAGIGFESRKVPAL